MDTETDDGRVSIPLDGWSVRRVQLSGRGMSDGSPRTVAALTKGGLAVHESVDRLGWSISQLTSGLRLPVSFVSMLGAIGAAVEYLRECCWTGGKEDIERWGGANVKRRAEIDNKWSEQ